MNIFPPMQFSDELRNQFDSFIDCLDHCIEDLFKTTKQLFKNWAIKDISDVQSFPNRIISLHFPFTYQNEQRLTKEKKLLLKTYKVSYIQHNIEFLNKYLKLIEENAEENEVIDLLLEYEVAGFNGLRKFNEDEKWLKEQLK